MRNPPVLDARYRRTHPATTKLFSRAAVLSTPSYANSTVRSSPKLPVPNRMTSATLR